MIRVPRSLAAPPEPSLEKYPPDPYVIALPLGKVPLRMRRHLNQHPLSALVTYPPCLWPAGSSSNQNWILLAALRFCSTRLENINRLATVVGNARGGTLSTSVG
jgi:hypothetical protein